MENQFMENQCHNRIQYVTAYDRGHYICLMCNQSTDLNFSYSNKGYNLICHTCLTKLAKKMKLSEIDILKKVHNLPYVQKIYKREQKEDKTCRTLFITVSAISSDYCFGMLYKSTEDNTILSDIKVGSLINDTATFYDPETSYLLELPLEECEEVCL